MNDPYRPDEEEDKWIDKDNARAEDGVKPAIVSVRVKRETDRPEDTIEYDRLDAEAESDEAARFDQGPASAEGPEDAMRILADAIELYNRVTRGGNEGTNRLELMMDDGGKVIIKGPAVKTKSRKPE